LIQRKASPRSTAYICQTAGLDPYVDMNHLNTADRIALAKQLQAMKREVLGELRSRAPHVDSSALSVGSDVHGHADDAELERQQELLYAEIEFDCRRLHDIELAERRLADGRYGVCADCGEEITRSRLLAQPAAIRCANCQATLESRRH
jgi:DnaK suppressor protein